MFLSSDFSQESKLIKVTFYITGVQPNLCLQWRGGQGVWEEMCIYNLFLLVDNDML